MTSNRAQSINTINSKYRGSSPERVSSNFNSQVGGQVVHTDVRTTIGQPAVRNTFQTTNVGAGAASPNQFGKPSEAQVITTTVPTTNAPVTWERPDLGAGSKKAGVQAQTKSAGVCGCPWWVWAILGTLILAGIAAGVVLLLTRNKGNDAEAAATPVVSATGPKTEKPAQQIVFADSKTNATATNGCAEGQYYSNGKCLKCPSGSAWNGTYCVKTNTTSNTTTTAKANTTASTTTTTPAKTNTTSTKTNTTTTTTPTSTKTNTTTTNTTTNTTTTTTPTSTKTNTTKKTNTTATTKAKHLARHLTLHSKIR